MREVKNNYYYQLTNEEWTALIRQFEFGDQSITVELIAENFQCIKTTVNEFDRKSEEEGWTSNYLIQRTYWSSLTNRNVNFGLYSLWPGDLDEKFDQINLFQIKIPLFNAYNRMTVEQIPYIFHVGKEAEYLMAEMTLEGLHFAEEPKDLVALDCWR